MKIINNYFNYITESKIDLILEESYIHFGKSFCDILKDINSPISKKLLDINGKDIDTTVGFVDADLSKDDLVIFTPVSKGTKYKYIGSNTGSNGLYRVTSLILLGDKAKFHSEDEICRPEIGSDVEIDKILSLDDMISFVEKNKNRVGIMGQYSIVRVYNEHGGMVVIKWKSNNDEYQAVAAMDCISMDSVDFSKKSEIKIGRLTKKILNKLGVPSDKEIEDFVNKYKSVIKVSNDALSRFKIVNGEDIRKYYLVDNYQSPRGTLGGSCMRGEGAQRYLDIYVENTKNISLVIFMSKDGSDKICGRALLWVDNKGRTIMDRIYTIGIEDEELFKEYARRNKYLYKLKQTYSDDTLLFNGIKVSNEDNIVIIELKEKDYDYYPYTDTFKYYNSVTGLLSNRKDSGINPEYMLNSTDGLVSWFNQ